MLKTISSVATQIISSITGGLIKFTGPASGQTRTITVPDANFTVARTDAAQTFTGDQTFNGGLTQRGSNPVPFVLLSSTIPFVMVSSGTRPLLRCVQPARQIRSISTYPQFQFKELLP